MQLEGQPSVFANLELFSAFVEHMPAAVAMLDCELRYLLTSRRWLSDYALENQDLVGREYYKIFPLFLHEQGRVSPPHSSPCGLSFENTSSNDSNSLTPLPSWTKTPVISSTSFHWLERWRKIFALSLAGETQRGDSAYFIKPDGSRQRVKWEIQPWRTRNGEIGGIMISTEFQESPSIAEVPDCESEPSYCRFRETATQGIWGTGSLSNTIEQLQQEIAERQQAQALQQESEERYRSLIAAMAEGIILQDANGIIRTCNAAAERILGVSADQLLGRTLMESHWLIITEEGEAISQEEHPLHLTLRTGQSFTDVIIGLYKPDSSLTWLSLNSQPLFRPQETTPYSAVVSLIDITKRKQIGAALRESEERFRATFEQAAVGITHAELDGSFVRVNQKFCDIVGYTREDILQRTLQDITHPEDREVDRKYLRSLLIGEIETYSLEKRYLRQDGEAIWVEITASLVHTPQGNSAAGRITLLPQYFLCVVQDISDRKAAEAALRNSEAKLRQRAQREELLNRLSNQIRRSLDLNTILETAVREIRHLLQIDRCQFAWYYADERRSYWEVVKEARNLDCAERTGRYPADLIGPLNQRLLNLEILRIDDVETIGDPIFQSFIRSFSCTSVLSLPMQTPSGTIGVINCIHTQEARPWTDWELELLQAVKAQLLIAIKQAELYAASRRSTQEAQEKATQLQQTLHELQRTQAQLIQSEKMSSLGQLVAGVAHEINNPVNFIYGNLIHAQGYFQELLGLLSLYRATYPHPPGMIQDYIEAIDLDFLMTDLTQLQDSMKIGAERIREIVRSLRTFSRLDESESKQVDIHSGIESTLMILQNRLKGKPGCPAISVIKQYGNLPLVECYPGQLNQVFMNLLTNAIDAVDEKSRCQSSQAHGTQEESIIHPPPTITITTGIVLTDKQEDHSLSEEERSKEEGDMEYCQANCFASPLLSCKNLNSSVHSPTISPTHVFICIADNGIGMTQKTQQQLFDPFFTTKAVGKGTGLGLAISYQIIVEKHGGDLRCNSALGDGAEFVIEIPIKHHQRQSQLSHK
ncbi:PAS domain S-box protein [Allocoleopsis franciscana]|uniref:histidine kinase n=1 Tax=Allocoleopsis franciscana PCC 7113 TaxID=1173027 RepID=K9W9Q9_9CYAN|nr:PAS domain S-box protein [Allocoleopsis franciscana]AFZ16509.1 PAS domain S-box [Allocoleopsis franciscana PCC 7113]